MGRISTRPSGSAVAGVCLPLKPGPLEKSSRARSSDWVYERPSYEWLNQATDLPHETIAPTFDSLKSEATTEPLEQFVSYKCWSVLVFMQSIRTNNDFEGWHHSLNRRAAGRSGLPLYMFVALLHKEAGLVSVQIRQVSERKLKRMQRAT